MSRFRIELVRFFVVLLYGLGYINGQISKCDYTDVTEECKDGVDEVSGVNSFLAEPINNRFLVSLQDGEDLPQDCFYHGCAGSFIAPDLILTAAHCIYEQIRGADVGTVLEPEMFAAHAPGCRHQSGYGRYKIAKYWLHERYRRSRLQNDIAILQLNQTVDFATILDYKVDKIQQDLKDNFLAVVGWGNTDPVDRRRAYNVAPLTAANNLQLINSTSCEMMLRNVNEFNTLEPGMICALGNGTDSCNGDSGGPLTYSKQGVNYVVGIVSWGSRFSQCDTNQVVQVPSVYTDVAYYQQWIQDILDSIATTASPSTQQSSSPKISPPSTPQSLPLSPSPMATKTPASQEDKDCGISLNGCECTTECFPDTYGPDWCEIDESTCDVYYPYYYEYQGYLYDYWYDFCQKDCLPADNTAVVTPQNVSVVQTTVKGCTCVKECQNLANDINGNWCEIDPATCSLPLKDWQSNPQTGFTWDYCVQEFRGISKVGECNGGCLCTPIFNASGGTNMDHYCLGMADETLESFSIDLTLPWCEVINIEECGKQFINCIKNC